MSSNRYSGRELEFMLRGEKPMAVFYRAVSESFDEKGGQDFSTYVNNGTLAEKRFYIQDGDCNFKMMYVVYCRIGEEWRADLYHTLKKIGRRLWNKDLENIEGWLLGYTSLNFDH